MDVRSAKKELSEIKALSRDLRSVEEELESLYSIATKMTVDYDRINVMTNAKNRLEEVMAKIDDYKSRLEMLIVEMLEKKQRCLGKLEKIEPRSLQTVLLNYYFRNMTLEQTAEAMGKSYRWTYDIYTTALEKYAEIS